MIKDFSQNESYNIQTMSKLIKERHISSYDLVKDMLEKIVEHNQIYNTFITILKEYALNRARALDEELINGEYRGPLHGIPIALKDNIFLKNVRCTMGSKVYENYIPKKDAHIVSLLEKSGAIIIGKLNIHEFAYGTTGDKSISGPVRNYYDMSRVPGGSSSGSAVSVAGLQCLGSIGTDTGGSVRIPAAFNKIVGMKPTFGRVSKNGVYSLCDSLDHVGPLTQTVFDNALIMNEIAGYDVNDYNSLLTNNEDFTELIDKDIRGIKIGVPKDQYFLNIDDKVKNEYDRVIQLLKNNGAIINYIELMEIEKLNSAFWTTLQSEGFHRHKYTIKNYSNIMDNEVVNRIISGENIMASEYIEAQHLKRRFKKYLYDLFQSTDLILTPTVPIEPPKIGKSTILLNDEETQLKYVLNKFTGITNLTGLPSLAMPASTDPKSLVSIQLIGNHLKETIIYQVASFIEKQSKNF